MRAMVAAPRERLQARQPSSPASAFPRFATVAALVRNHIDAPMFAQEGLHLGSVERARIGGDPRVRRMLHEGSAPAAQNAVGQIQEAQEELAAALARTLVARREVREAERSATIAKRGRSPRPSAGPTPGAANRAPQQAPDETLPAPVPKLAEEGIVQNVMLGIDENVVAPDLARHIVLFTKIREPEFHVARPPRARIEMYEGQALQRGRSRRPSDTRVTLE